MFEQYLEVKQSKIGVGIFTSTQIPSGVPITEFRGNVFDVSQLPEDSSIFLQIGQRAFLGPVGSINGVDFINHSCDPNCFMHVVGNRVILYSLYVIPANSELTFDYSTTSTDTLDSWKMECKCQSYKCRKTISGFQYLDPKLQEDYKKRGMVPLFIAEPRLIQMRNK